MVSGPDPPPPEAETDGVLPEQWVGNLLTLRWWKEAWLTEGFASYVAYLGADHAEPAWNVVRSRFDVHGTRSKHAGGGDQSWTSGRQVFRCCCWALVALAQAFGTIRRRARAEPGS